MFPKDYHFILKRLFSPVFISFWCVHLGAEWSIWAVFCTIFFFAGKNHCGDAIKLNVPSNKLNSGIFPANDNFCQKKRTKTISVFVSLDKEADFSPLAVRRLNMQFHVHLSHQKVVLCPYRNTRTIKSTTVRETGVSRHHVDLFIYSEFKARRKKKVPLLLQHTGKKNYKLASLGIMWGELRGLRKLLRTSQKHYGTKGLKRSPIVPPKGV